MKHSGAYYHGAIALYGLKGGRNKGNVRLFSESLYVVESHNGQAYFNKAWGYTPSLEKATEYSKAEATKVAQAMGGRILRITSKFNY